jgi:hypothetical protein
MAHVGFAEKRVDASRQRRTLSAFDQCHGKCRNDPGGYQELIVLVPTDVDDALLTLQSQADNLDTLAGLFQEQDQLSGPAVAGLLDAHHSLLKNALVIVVAYFYAPLTRIPNV